MMYIIICTIWYIYIIIWYIYNDNGIVVIKHNIMDYNIMVIYHQLHVNPQYSWIQTSWPPHCRVTGMMGIGLTIKVSGAIHPVWYIYCYSMSSSLFYVSTWPPPRDFPTDFFHLLLLWRIKRVLPATCQQCFAPASQMSRGVVPKWWYPFILFYTLSRGKSSSTMKSGGTTENRVVTLGLG